MRDNINKVSQRGERLDALQDKTDNLAQSAQGFRRGANRVRKQMWWKDMKMRVCIVIGVIVLLLIIILPAGTFLAVFLTCTVTKANVSYSPYRQAINDDAGVYPGLERVWETVYRFGVAAMKERGDPSLEKASCYGLSAPYDVTFCLLVDSIVGALRWLAPCSLTGSAENTTDAIPPRATQARRAGWLQNQLRQV